MKTNYLLSNKYKIPGWIILISGILLYIFLGILDYDGDFFNTKVISLINYDGHTEKSFFKIIKNDINDEIISICIILGGLIVGFTKEKEEDEFIYKLRKDSLVWAIILNYSILLFTVIFIYDMDFLSVMMYNMFTPLLFFIIRFNFLKIKTKSHEE